MGSKVLIVSRGSWSNSSLNSSPMLTPSVHKAKCLPGFLSRRRAPCSGAHSHVSLRFLSTKASTSQKPSHVPALHSSALDLLANSLNLARQVGSLVGGDADGDDWARDTSSTAQSKLGRHVDVRGVLVLGQERDVEDDRERGSVGSQDDELAGAAGEGLGGLAGRVLELVFFQAT